MFKEDDSEASPILDKEEVVSRLQTEQVQVFGVRCCCGSVWCKSCYTHKGGSKRFSDRLQTMNPERVREVVLTVDPKKFKDGQEAYEVIRDKKALSQFIRDLGRYGGVEILRYQWILEWHKNGFPHWHFFLEVPHAGSAGQIGNETLLRFWPHGLIYESYIRSEKHWLKLTSYFGKHGYFNKKEKQHQLELPEWAKDVDYKIRKTGGTQTKTDNNKCLEETTEELGDDPEKPERMARTYREVLSGCGQKTLIRVKVGETFTQTRVLKMPYGEFRKLPGEYVAGNGYQITSALFKALLKGGVVWEKGNG